MSYQVLARKWRPKSFQELVGQEHVVTVLVNALTQQRLHHAYLFTGTRGVGKTTIARIFAKSLNCQQGITATPCGSCDACVDIDQGKFVDLLEIDAASRTKVDDTREILDNVQYAPTRGRYKVYLIDEVHMLSRSSFNALLKTLEEPPEHVKFILATTDPQKLPVTVLSRCLQFHLKALTLKQISDKISEILRNEAVTFEDEAIALLAKAARGSMRDCLSLTDQSIAQGNGNIARTDVQQMLGGVDRDWVFQILIALLKQDAAGLMHLSLNIASYAPNYSQLSAELMQLLHQIAMAQVVDSDFSLPPDQQQLLARFCQLMSPEDVQLYYQIVLAARKDLPYVDDEQAAFDMMLLRLLAFKPISHSGELANTTSEHSSADQKLGLDDLTTTPLSANKSAKNSAPVETTQDSALKHEQPIVTQHNQPDIDSSAQAKQSEELQANEQESAESSESVLNTEPTSTPNVNLANLPESEAKPAPDNAITSAPLTHDKVEKTESTVAAAIATRNMLRSRKKSMEKAGKKSSGAVTRLPSSSEKPEPDFTTAEAVANSSSSQAASVAELPDLPQQPYSEDAIDPAKIKLANQVDKWAHMIDSMSLVARLRQLAIHATIDEKSTDDLLILQLDQSIRHLNSDAAHKQLEAQISQYLQRKVTVELNIVEKTVADPYQIQADINAKRYEYAKQVLAEDDIVQALQQHFQAELDQETIVAR
ncbi:DNA polymerase III, gamma subunit /DNA polymerase III, tau subunit [Colwellia chukchiensis]|uniref:DNA polymerase III subunit gamma/tau n=1 Tax=Colwellia chukchiensis TaxID=641665 RepID=A0A1H7GIZ7_9GAMM|nr:DNA polymerase III subunit gamma/tau [Colwellia chukchiensis]SEK38098.1 DNA polymerase III, gamma subunit /DNA polymerase III, tau subunit [Colwellia chukchiensis]